MRDGEIWLFKGSAEAGRGTFAKQHASSAPCAEPLEASGSCSSLQKSQAFEIPRGERALHPAQLSAEEQLWCPHAAGGGGGWGRGLSRTGALTCFASPSRGTPRSYHRSPAEPLPPLISASKESWQIMEVSVQWLTPKKLGLGGWLGESGGKSGFS